MSSRKMESKQRPGSRARWPRLVSLALGLVLIVIGGIVTMELMATKADGAPVEKSAEEDKVEGENDKQEEGEEGAEEESNGKAPVPVEVTQVTGGEVSAYISSTANLVAENDVQVLAEVEGRVLTLRVEEGDTVSRGQELATLVRNDEQIRFKKAELKESQAKMAFERGEDLVAKELISQEEFDRLRVDHQIAGQELAEARWDLAKTTIRAPFSGRVTGRMIQVGQHVRPGDQLFQVTDFDPLIARIFLPERDVLGLDEGREVRISLNADEEVAFAGRIRQISPVVDTATGTVKLTIEASAAPVLVRPGSFVTVGIVRETRAEALLLPRESVLRELQRAHVFVADGEVAKKQAVTLGLEEGNLVEALSGVEAGDQVIVAGQGGLKDGSPIKILDGAESAG